MGHELLNLSSYITGLYDRIDTEQTVTQLKIHGELPKALSGMFVQNSPNPRFEPVGAYHWFDGDGMVHGVHLDGGQAHYRNRYVETRAFKEEGKEGGPLWRGLLEPINQGRSRDKDTANTDLVWHNGKLLALWWLGGEPYALNVPSLETVGPVDFGGTLNCGMAAHPKVDPITGDMMFIDFDVYQAPYLRYGVVSSEGRVSHCVPIDISGPRLFHDIAITTNYTVLLDLPMSWDPKASEKGRRRITFSKESPSRFGVIPRHGSSDSIRWFDTPSCYIYHTINAWEETNAQGEKEIVMTACVIDDPIPTTPHSDEPTIPRLYFLRLHPFLTRYRFNLEQGTSTIEPLDDVPTEFPRMNDNLLGQKSRYGYHPRVAKEPTLLFDGFLKYDLERGGSAAYDYGPNRFGGETVFVPHPDGTNEDDGWVVSMVVDRREDTSELWVYNAGSDDREPVARVCMPQRLPFAFHAHWVPGEGL